MMTEKKTSAGSEKWRNYLWSKERLSSLLLSPFQEDRHTVRQLVEEGEFHEVFVKCDLNVCEERDPKGLYKRRETVKFHFHWNRFTV